MRLSLNLRDEHFHLVDDGGRVVLDFAENELFGESAKDDVEGIPNSKLVLGFEGSNGAFGFVNGMVIAGQAERGVVGEFVESVGCFFEFLVFEKLVDELPAWIEIVVVVFVIRVAPLLLWQEEAAFDFHQRGGQHEKIASYLQLYFLHAVDDFEILVEDEFDWNIVDVDLVLAYKEKQEVEGTFEDGEFYSGINFCDHGKSSPAILGNRQRQKPDCE